MFFLCLWFGYQYSQTGDQTYREWTGLAFVSLCTALGIQRALPTTQETGLQLPQQQINADIKTDTVTIEQRKPAEQPKPETADNTDIDAPVFHREEERH